MEVIEVSMKKMLWWKRWKSKRWWWRL